MIPFLRKDQKTNQQLTPDQEKEKDLAEDFYTDGIRARQPYENDWYMNMAFALGRQWVSWNSTTRRLERPRVPSWRVRIVSNKIMPTVLHTIAKLTKGKPGFNAMPATTEDPDLNAAKLSKKVLESIHRAIQMDISTQRLFFWKIIYGTAFKDIFFNKERGIHKRELKTEKVQQIKLNDEKEPELDEAGQEQYQEIERPMLNKEGREQYYDFHTGEADCEILSPFSIIPEGGATNLENSFRVMKLTSKPVEWIKKHFAEGSLVKADSSSSKSPIEKQLFSLMNQKFTSSYTEEVAKKGDSLKGGGFALIKELREKPSKEHPKGRQIITAGGVLLHSGGLPYKFMQKRNTFGLVKYDYIEIGESFWGRTPITDMRPLQIERNKTLSQLIENKNLMLKLKWLVAKRHNISATAITSEPAEVIQYTAIPGVPEPHPIPAPPLPNVEPIINISDDDLDDIGLINRVSKGEAPPGVKSGVAIQFLQEKDQDVFGPVLSRFEAKEGEAGTYMLEIVKEKYKETRLLKIVGENNEVEVFDFMASDDMPTDVWVESGSTLPRSLVAKQQLILQYYEKGMFGDPQDEKVRVKALRLAEIGGLEVVYEEIAVDEREAEREHKLWEQGQNPPVNDFDNHSFMIQRHDIFRKSDRYRKIIMSNPEAEQIITAHITTHMQSDPNSMAMMEQRKIMEEQTTAAGEQQADQRAVAASKVQGEVSDRELKKGDQQLKALGQMSGIIDKEGEKKTEKKPKGKK